MHSVTHMTMREKNEKTYRLDYQIERQYSQSIRYRCDYPRRYRAEGDLARIGY